MPTDKETRLAALEAAKAHAEASTSSLSDLEAQFNAAREEALAAASAHEIALAAAFAEEDAQALATATANEERHARECVEHRRHIASRKSETPPDHTAIEVVAIDGATHEVVAAHGLLLGHRGFGGEAREGSRYGCACGLSVDVPHDELDDERFEQGKAVDCGACNTAGVAKSDYLTANEQLAHARAENKLRNQSRR